MRAVSLGKVSPREGPALLPEEKASTGRGGGSEFQLLAASLLDLDIPPTAGEQGRACVLGRESFSHSHRKEWDLPTGGGQGEELCG